LALKEEEDEMSGKIEFLGTGVFILFCSSRAE
jgi:hypothetical protein